MWLALEPVTADSHDCSRDIALGAVPESDLHFGTSGGVGVEADGRNGGSARGGHEGWGHGAGAGADHDPGVQKVRSSGRVACLAAVAGHGSGLALVHLQRGA